MATATAMTWIDDDVVVGDGNSMADDGEGDGDGIGNGDGVMDDDGQQWR